MATYDLSKILTEYDDEDFGFSAVSEAEYQGAISKNDETVEEYKLHLREVEKLVMPFLTKLLKTADKEYIYWPNRKELLERQIQRILNLTRKT